MERRKFIALLLCVMLSCTVAFAQDRQARAENNLIEAVSKFNSADYKGARQILTTLLSVIPDDDAVNYYLGLCDFALGDLEEAETFLVRAGELDPSNYWYRDRLAALYASVGQFQKATKIYEEMTEAFPKNSDPYYALLSLYAQQNQTDKLLETLARVSELSGDSPQLLAMQGDAKMSEYEDSTALVFYDKALEMDSSYPPALLGKAEIMRMRRNYDAYFENLDKYMFSDIVPPAAKADYLHTLYQNIDGRFYQNFRTQLDELATGVNNIHPNDSTILQCLGSYYYSTGRHEEAKTCLKRSRDLYPESYSSTVLYVQFLTYTGDWEEVAQECESAFERFPFEKGFVNTKVSAYYSMGDYNAAIRENVRLINMLPWGSEEMASAYASLGDIYHQVGYNKESYAAYELALKNVPDYALVLNNYAYFLCLDGKKLKKAYKMSKRAVELEPDNSSYLDTIGWILYLQGKPEEAKAHFKRAMIYGGKESPECLSHYAKVLDALGEKELSKYYQNLADQMTVELPEIVVTQ